MDWNEITVNVSVADVETASAIANMTVPYGIYIEDYSDLEQSAWDIAHIDLIDEELISKDRNIAKIHIYVPEEENVTESIAFLEERLALEKIEFNVEAVKVSDKDWNENWKKFFVPTEIGEKLAIVPSWETYDNVDGRKILSIDPGAAFGTGTHATTSLCLELLEKYVTEGSKTLDVGCGSGILAVASVLLGAREAFGVDIDSVAVKVAKENAEINKVSDMVKFEVGDLTKTVKGKYNVICANIVADAIIMLSKNIKSFFDNDAVYIVSGIIDIRADEVKNALSGYGLKIIEERKKDNWYALVLKEC